MNPVIDELNIFTGNGHPALAQSVCDYLEMPLGQAEVFKFANDNSFVRIKENIRQRDVFIIQPTCFPVNDNLMELLIMIDCCRRASAERITAVIPYYGYARQDRKDEGRVPITAKLVANLVTRAGADRVVAMDLHAAQIQGFFDVPVDHLYAAPVLNDYFRSLNLESDQLTVVSPDEGSIKRALGHQKRLGGNLAIVDKRRSGETTRQENIIGGPVEGRIALIFDDMISTAGSICGAAKVVKEAGAREIYVAATHAVLCGPAVQRISEAPIDRLIVTDTIQLSEDDLLDKCTVLSVAPLLGEAIKRIHCNESVSRLFSE